MNKKMHDRWYNADNDESHDTWLFGDKNEAPKESWGEQLWKIAEQLSSDALDIRDKSLSDEKKFTIANHFKVTLVKCVLDPNLDDLTIIYRDKKADNILGYETGAISKFMNKLSRKYPQPNEPFEEPDFDCYDEYCMEALEQLMIQMVEKKISVPAGVSLRRILDDDTEEEVWEMSIDDTFIISYKTVDDSYVVNENYNTLNDLVCKTPVLVELLQSIARENDY